MIERRSLDELTAAPHARPFDGGEPVVIRLQLDAGERVEPHTHPERRVVLYLRSGRLELDVDDETQTIETGDVVRVDGRHELSPKAIETSDALLVLARRTD